VVVVVVVVRGGGVKAVVASSRTATVLHVHTLEKKSCTESQFFITIIFWNTLKL
jgi:hypothetical protein